MNLTLHWLRLGLKRTKGLENLSAGGNNGFSVSPPIRKLTAIALKDMLCLQAPPSLVAVTIPVQDLRCWQTHVSRAAPSGPRRAQIHICHLPTSHN